MDCTFLTENGKFNFRVGAVIHNNGKFLMARNPNETREFYYSVGGRVRMGETVEDAIIRELYEETGIECQIEKMYCIHENFFTDDDGVPFHEISVFFEIKPDEKLLNIENGHLTDDGPNGEYLVWINPDTCTADYYPEFFKEYKSDNIVKHYVTKEH